jgi:3'-5' exoribonuclease
MRYINTLREGDNIRSIYLCKSKRSAETRNGKPYDNLVLQDKTGTLDGKVWDPNSGGIADYDEMDFVEVFGEVVSYNNNLQLNIKQLRKPFEDEYVTADYMPTTEKDVEGMYAELLGYVNQIGNKYLHALAEQFYIKDTAFVKKFKEHSAAKSVHHSFAGGLLEHTLSIVKFCEYLADTYALLNRDLLYSAALFHDIGKTKELSDFPENDYTDAGNLLGHIVMGCEMLNDQIRQIEGFPVILANELKHCILAHHGELEYGSPKKPALAEALCLSFADNLDAKMQTMKELLKGVPENNLEWQGFNRLLETNVRRTSS